MLNKYESYNKSTADDFQKQMQEFIKKNFKDGNVIMFLNPDAETNNGGRGGC